VKYSDEMRAEISKDAVGKVVESLDWCPDFVGGYWVMAFKDNTEICFRMTGEPMYTRESTSEQAKNKVVESLTWDAGGRGGGYWTMRLKGGAEFWFRLRLMAELV
jgi:hypothetical protein